MKHYKILFLIFSLTLLSFGGWFAVLNSVDPYSYGARGQLLFFCFSLLLLWGVVTLVAYFVRSKKQDSNKSYLIATSLRQGFILALGLIGLVVFRAMDVLNVLSASVYIIALLLIEFFYRHRKLSAA